MRLAGSQKTQHNPRILYEKTAISRARGARRAAVARPCALPISFGVSDVRPGTRELTIARNVLYDNGRTRRPAGEPPRKGRRHVSIAEATAAIHVNEDNRFLNCRGRFLPHICAARGCGLATGLRSHQLERARMKS